VTPFHQANGSISIESSSGARELFMRFDTGHFCKGVFGCQLEDFLSGFRA
jgi:hypothetical protein